MEAEEGPLEKRPGFEIVDVLTESEVEVSLLRRGGLIKTGGWLSSPEACDGNKPLTYNVSHNSKLFRCQDGLII